MLLASRSGAQIPRPTLDESNAFAGAVRHDYVAGDGKTPLRLYVFAPSGPTAELGKSHPGIVFFHGSGWMEGWVTQFSAYARALATDGMVTICADYRTLKSHNAAPWDGMADARCALRWAREHAVELGLDPHRLAAAGSSAGAHLALSAAIFTEKEMPTARPDALVLFSAVTDTTEEGYLAGVPLFHGREKEFSPRQHLKPGLPPLLLLHGEKDAWVNVESNRRFAREAMQLGDSVELIVFAGRGHAFYNDPVYRPGVRADDFAFSLFLTEQFLAKLGWISAPARIESPSLSEATP